MQIVVEEQQGPIQAIYKKVKTYLPEFEYENQTVDQINKRFENVLGEADKVVEQTTNRFKRTRATTAKYVPTIQNLKKYANYVTDKVITQIEQRLHLYISQLQEKKTENDSDVAVVEKDDLKVRLVNVLENSRKLNRLVLKRLTTEFVNYSKTYPFLSKINFIEQIQRIPYLIQLETKVIYSVVSELMSEFVEKQTDFLKVTYGESKSTVTMILNYKFNQEEVKNKFIQALQQFKSLTVQTVQKGLEIKVDREFLIQNYKAISLKIIELIKGIKEKSKSNVTTVSTSSRQLYNRIIRTYKVQKILLSDKARKSVAS